MTKYIYAFDEGQKSMKDLLGGKGANLSEMKRLGFTCARWFYNNNCRLYRILKTR